MHNVKQVLAMLLVSASLITVAQGSYSGTDTAVHCIAHAEPVGTGCWDTTCSTGGTIFEPAQGYAKIHSFTCCYQNGTSSTSTDHGCSTSASGCCSFIASAPDCPNFVCPHNEP